MEQKNVILAIVLSILVLVGFEVFREPAPAPKQQAATENGVTPQPGGTAETATAGSVSAPEFEMPRMRGEVLTESARVTIKSPVLTGSINLTGARLDDLVLPEYKETLAEDSPNITLLSPVGSSNAYYSEFNWWAKGITTPKSDTVWTADKTELTPEQPVTLSWTSPEGVLFQQKYALDENYMFTVTQTVVNNSAASASIAPYGLIKRIGTPQVEGFYILHEGFLGSFGEGLKEEQYEDVQDASNRSFQFNSTGGWLGITDKYWQLALIPDQAASITSKYLAKPSKNDFNYQADFIIDQQAIAPGATLSTTSHLFAGAKKADLIETYGEELKAENFELSVDFGWFAFLTRPMYKGMHWLNSILGNFGLAILVLTLIIKVLLLPLAHKSYVSMSRMKLLQPKMADLKERFGDDRQKMNQAMMELYKKEKVNPLAGCLPILVQIPIFFALYKVLFINIEMRHAPFFGWIHDLSAPDPLGVLTAFGMIDWNVPAGLALVNIGIWPIIMGITMYLQQKLNPAPADPVQAKIFTFMPIMFTFMLGSFPAGLVIYWAWNNTLSIAQQYLIMKKMGVAVGGGAAKTS